MITENMGITMLTTMVGIMGILSEVSPWGSRKSKAPEQERVSG